jgi:hypothetical protein
MKSLPTFMTSPKLAALSKNSYRSALSRSILPMSFSVAQWSASSRSWEKLSIGLDNHRDIVSFRNILAHGYDAIDNRIVWNIIEADLDNLIEDVEKLLKSSSRS